MKRAVLLFILTFVIILYSGCDINNLNKNKVNNIEGKEISSENDYNILEKEYTVLNKENKPFTVKYAQISGLENERLESQINNTLKLALSEWLNKNCEWAEEFQVEEKYKDSRYLSLCYTIYSENSQGKDLMGTFTRVGVTVDIHTGERIFIDKLIEDTDSLKQRLENYNYGNEFSPPINTKEADEIIHYASISEKEYFEEVYNNDHHVYNFMFSYLRVKPSFYLTNNKLVITRDEYDLNDIFIDFKL